MKFILKCILIVLIVLFALLAFNFMSHDPDATYELRGRYMKSTDGDTFLVIEDNNGGKCGPIYVDKKIWPHNIGEQGKIAPGEHTVECGGWVKVFVKAGTIYSFNYWGP